MAGLGFKDFANGNVLTGDELDGYLMQQTALSSIGQGQWGGVQGAFSATLTYGLDSDGPTTISVRGTVSVDSTPGTVALAWAQNAATAVNTTVLTGSWLRVERVA